MNEVPVTDTHKAATEPLDYASILCCPKCAGDLLSDPHSLTCVECRSRYPINDGIPRLFHQPPSRSPHSDATLVVKEFYEQTPFPNYDDTDSAASLIKKSRAGVFARLLDEQIPFGAKVLECGCGTGQLSNFLALAHRTVFGADMSVASLTLGHHFKEQNAIDNVRFVQMNILAPAFKPELMDIVISNGVLSAIKDPYPAFLKLCSLVKPGGYLVLGFYHRYARLGTDLRRILFRISRGRFQSLDPRLRRRDIGQAQKTAWFADQYNHPQETKHTIGIVLSWLRKANFEFIKSIPSSVPGRRFSEDERLFVAERPGNLLERLLVELPMALTGSDEGGFFTMIGRKLG